MVRKDRSGRQRMARCRGSTTWSERREKSSWGQSRARCVARGSCLTRRESTEHREISPLRKPANCWRKKLHFDRIRIFERSFFGTPWTKPDPLDGLDQMTLDQIAEWHGAIPPGVIARHGTSPLYPPQVPDLIGVKDRKYLDHTGLQRHDSIVDMMRYAAQ